MHGNTKLKFTVNVFQNLMKLSFIYPSSGRWNSNNNLNILFLYKLDVKSQIYTTPNSQWNNENCLYGSHPIVFIAEWTTIIQHNTTHVYLIKLVRTVPQIRPWALSSNSSAISHSYLKDQLVHNYFKTSQTH